MVCAASEGSGQPAHTRSLIKAFASRLNILIAKLLTEQYLEFLSFKGGFTGWSKSALVKIPHCWKSHAADHMSVLVSSSVSEKYTSKVTWPNQVRRKAAYAYFWLIALEPCDRGRGIFMPFSRGPNFGPKFGPIPNRK